jgi:chlorobactene lauroyltransferase
VKGEEHVKSWRIDRKHDDSPIPLIVYCSHGGWWDAAFAIALTNGRLKVESYGMMEEKQLKKYRFFAKVGMFSVHRSNARSAMKSLKYAAELLKDSRKVLWMFPQGELVHQEIRPIQAYTGMANLVGMLGKAWCVPIAIRYDFLHEQQPEAWLSIGQPELMTLVSFPDKLSMTEHFRTRLTNLMDDVKDDVMHDRHSEYAVFLCGKTSVEKRWDAVRGME